MLVVSRNWRVYNRSVRASSFQSRYFRSSPTRYGRCCWNSELYPCNGLRCEPARSPSTTSLAASSRSSIAVTTSADSTAVILSRTNRVEEPGDHLVRIDAIGFRLIIHEHAMTQHGKRDRRHVFEGRRRTAVEKRRRLGA